MPGANDLCRWRSGDLHQVTLPHCILTVRLTEPGWLLTEPPPYSRPPSRYTPATRRERRSSSWSEFIPTRVDGGCRRTIGGAVLRLEAVFHHQGPLSADPYARRAFRGGPLRPSRCVLRSWPSSRCRSFSKRLQAAASIRTRSRTGRPQRVRLCLQLRPGLRHRSLRILASADDAEQRLDNSILLDSPDLDFQTGRFVGLRFPGVQIPKGAQIVGAKVQFTAAPGSTRGAADGAHHRRSRRQCRSLPTTPASLGALPSTASSVQWDLTNPWTAASGGGRPAHAGLQDGGARDRERTAVGPGQCARRALPRDGGHGHSQGLLPGRERRRGGGDHGRIRGTLATRWARKNCRSVCRPLWFPIPPRTISPPTARIACSRRCRDWPRPAAIRRTAIAACRPIPRPSPSH